MGEGFVKHCEHSFVFFIYQVDNAGIMIDTEVETTEAPSEGIVI